MNDKFEPKDLLFMDKMLLPKIVTGLYWIGIISFLLSGVLRIFVLNEMAYGIATIILGPFAMRLYAELLIIGFKAYEKLSLVVDNYENHETENIMNSKFELKDLLVMDKMLFPKIITGLYWIGITCCLLLGVLMLFEEDPIKMALGIATIIFGPLFLRLYAEMAILGFKVYEKLSILANNYENKNNTADKEQ